jgi:G3E family GTPase
MRTTIKRSGRFLHIPTTIITGFLGAGKTTVINHLLCNKPAGQRWAVLINEFGRVGVDASMLAPHSEVSIREISGGCLCCTAGHSFEAALNRLIRETSPDRILIEPTGIGHPLKIIRSLSSGYYREVLDLKATIALVDARKLGELKYREHPSFQDQINLADVLVASKADCYNAADYEAFRELAEAAVPLKSFVCEITCGQLDLKLLDIERNEARMPAFPDAHHIKSEPFLSSVNRISPHDEPKPVDSDCWKLHEGSGDGYCTGSWSIGSGYHFESAALAALLRTLPFERVKGIMQCRDGWLKINGGEGPLDISSTGPINSSRLEIMDIKPLHCDRLDLQLRDTLSSTGTAQRRE